MNSNQLHLVVMAGGSGTRFWPKSTQKTPKQLLAFGRDSTKTLLTQTMTRFDHLVDRKNRWIVTTGQLSLAVREQVGDSVHILAEPQGRNTAPCVFWSAKEVLKKDPNAVMLVMPSDHFIKNEAAFLETIGEAAAWASKTGDLVTLGVKPDRAETGYGYLKLGKSIEGRRAIPLAAFVEKPNRERAEEFLRAGNYLWNGGMFVWRADAILKAFNQYMPELEKVWAESQGSVEKAYPKMTATSIDYGVMEKAENVVAFELNCGWDDLGSWTSLETLAHELDTKRPEGVVGQGRWSESIRRAISSMLQVKKSR